jgi:nitrous oxide reductase accessory protein NosL
MTTTVDVYLVGPDIDAARANFPFFDEDEAADYARDYGGEVFTAEATVTVDPSTVREA